MSLGRLVVDLVANTGNFIQGINGAQRAAQTGAASIVASFGTLVKAQITADIAMRAAAIGVTYFTSAIERAGQAIDSAASFGTLPEKFYNLQYAVESAGDSFEPVSKVMGVLSKELSEIGSAAEGKGKLITALGLDFKALKAADPADAIAMVAKALQDVEDPTTRARTGTALLGKAYKEAAPGLLSLAGAGAVASGVSAQLLTNLDDLGDTMGAAGARANNLATVVMGHLAPQLTLLGKAMLGAKDDSGTFGATLADTLSPAITTVAMVANGATTTFKLFALSLAAAEKAKISLATGDFKGLLAIPEQYKDAAKGIMADSVAMQKAIQDAAKGPGAAPAIEETKDATAGATAEAKKWAAILAALAGAGKEAVSPIAQAFQRVRDDILKAKVEARDFDIAKFAQTKGATPALVKKYTLLVDTLAAETGLKSFREEMKGMNRELALVGKGEAEVSLANLRTKLEDAKVPADKVTEAVEKLRALLTAKTDVAFAKDLEAANIEISKIGKNTRQQAEIDIRTKYKDDPAKQTEMLAANTRKYVAETQEQVADMMRKLEAEAAGIGATPLTLYVAELRETQRLNPLITDEIIKSATAQKAANLDLAKTYEEKKARGEDAAQTIASGLGDIARGTVSAKDGFDSLGKSIADLILKYTLLKPFEDFLSKQFTGGASGGGFIDTAVAGITSFFTGGGRALGGGVARNSVHEVVEQEPELLSRGGKTFLMTGNEGGNITPLSKVQGAGGSGDTIIYQTNNIDARGADSSVTQQIQDAMKATKAQTIAEVQALTQRGAMRR